MEFHIQSQVLEIMNTRPEQKIDWGVSLIQAPQLWYVTKGEGIKVLVLDTGVEYTHEDLAPNFRMGVNFTTPNQDDFVDRQGHGKQVA